MISPAARSDFFYPWPPLCLRSPLQTAYHKPSYLRLSNWFQICLATLLVELNRPRQGMRNIEHSRTFLSAKRRNCGSQKDSGKGAQGELTLEPPTEASRNLTKEIREPLVRRFGHHETSGHRTQGIPATHPPPRLLTLASLTGEGIIIKTWSPFRDDYFRYMDASRAYCIPLP